MTEGEDKLGTPDPVVADAPEQTETSETPETDDQGGLSAEDTEKLHLSWKVKAEKAAQLEAENAELKRRLEQTPAATSEESDDSDDGEDGFDYSPLFRDPLFRSNLDLAQRGDPAAKLAVRNTMQQHRLIIEQGHAQQLRDIVDVEERRAVFEHFRKHPKRFGDPSAAKADLDARRFAERTKALEAENETLKKSLEKAGVKPPGGPNTSIRGGPEPTNRAKTMTSAQWRQRQASLPDDDRMAEQAARRAGKLVVKD